MRPAKKTYDKKKLILLIIALVIGSTAVWAVSTNSLSNPSKINNTASQTNLLSADKSNDLLSSNNDTVTIELFFKTMAAVLIVIALAVAVMYFSRKVLPKLTNFPGKEIRVLETAHLGPRKAVHLLEIAGHRLLIGSTHDNITMLTHVTDPLIDGFGTQTNNETEAI